MFAELVRESGVTGATSNPTIFAKAISGSGRYDDQLRALIESGMLDSQSSVLRAGPRGRPTGRHVPSARIRRKLWAGRLRLVRVHARPRRRRRGDDDAGTGSLPTARGPPQCPDQGRGDRRRHRRHPRADSWRCQGQRDPAVLATASPAGDRCLPQRSGASRGCGESSRTFPLSRRSSSPASTPWSTSSSHSDSPLRGRIAIANAELAYARQLRTLESPRWRQLAMRGAKPQRVLWASTATKDPAYSDTRYVQELIAPNVINTMPLSTLRSIRGPRRHWSLAWGGHRSRQAAAQRAIRLRGRFCCRHR